MSKNCYIINLEKFSDKRGTLIPFQIGNNSPFDIKRVFYIYDVPESQIRGCHVNINTKFLFIAISGVVTIEVKEKNKEEIFILNSPDRALFVDRGLYKRMYNFSRNSVLLCLCDSYYSSSDSSEAVFYE